MKLLGQTVEERAEFNWRWDFSYRDIPAGIATDTALVVPLGGENLSGGYYNGVNNSTPQMYDGDLFVKAVLHLITPWAYTADAGLNTTTMSFGDQGSATRFFSAVEGNLQGSYVNDSWYSTLYKYVTANLPQYLQFTLNSMSGKTISNLNQGAIYIEFQLFRAAAKEKGLLISNPPYV